LRLATTLRYFYLSYLSKPVSDRALYRVIRQIRPKKVLEIGVGTTDRTLRMLDLAQRLVEGEAVRYAAIDLFEARGQNLPKLSLKEAHRLFKAASAQAQLIPGDPSGAVARVANSLPDVDLVLISSAHDDASLAGTWFYLPRMLHAKSVVLRETVTNPGEMPKFETIDAAAIRERAGTNRRRAA
jgi:predicted O-methyltransferase YrrM